LVSIEEDLKSKVQHITNKISQALTEIGEKPYSRVDEARAIFIVAMREKGGACTLIGRISPADVMLNVLSALADCKIISQDFGKAVLYAWMKADEPPKE
jgi:ABC-type hemin transport system substrate-binding protein